MQELINSWGILMEVTWGAIRTDKSWYYLVDSVQKRGKWIASYPVLDIDLVATDIHGERMTLSHIRYEEIAEIMGVWMVPAGNMKNIVYVLKSRTVE